MRRIIFLAILILTIISCRTIMTRIYVTVHKTAYIHQYTNGKSSYIFMPMAHIGKPAFYNDAKRKIDSLRKDGYTVLYEGLVIDHINNDSLKIDTYLRKFKKITGVYISPYANKKNRTLRIPNIKGITTQTDENTGIDIKNDIRADFNLIKLIDLFEKDKGEIVLSNCDLKTNLNDKYRCSKINQNDCDYLMITLRNQLILQKMNETKSNKILIVYGAGHQYGVEKLIMKQDSTWHYVYSNYPKQSSNKK